MIAPIAQIATAAAPLVVAVSGKLGEFLQGVDSEGNPFLYTATLSSTETGSTAAIRRTIPSSSLQVVQAAPERAKTLGTGMDAFQKTRRALQSLLTRKQIASPWDFEVRLINSPVSAKGLGASSTDMAASLLATARYLGLEVTNQELFTLMCDIERSDYLFQPDRLVRANPLSAEYTVQGSIPPLWLMAWDTEPDRTISTEEVAYLDHIRRAYASEYLELAGYCESAETDALLAAATRSGQINQSFLPKPCHPWALNQADENQAGLVVAHSGTFMAFALPQEGCDLDRLAYLEATLLSNGFAPVLLQTGRLGRPETEQQELV